MFKRSKGAELKTRRAKKPVTQHPTFVPMMAAWGAAVAGACVYVLPYPIVKRLTPQPIFDVIEPNTHAVAVAVAAVCGAIGMFVVAKLVQRSASASEDGVQAIDPAEELGSESLDAPLDVHELVDDKEYDEDTYVEEDFETFADPDTEWVEDFNEDDWREDEFVPAGDPVQAVDALNDHLSGFAKGPQAGDREDDVQIMRAAPVSDFDESQVDELDLDAFVEEQPAGPPAIETAIDKLRAVPPQDLSLVQMVERLAVALHENKTASNDKAKAQRRDAELAEALKTLSRLTEEGLDTTDATKGEMREALSKLQNLRGAA